jgi:hypothetical protein
MVLKIENDVAKPRACGGILARIVSEILGGAWWLSFFLLDVIVKTQFAQRTL